MITLKNINKYFYRHKKNEIHVIDDTSLELGDTGLVALLGPSGCGKTTLLNAIGGLDKINSGRIYINGEKMPRSGSSKKDKIRVMNIGYIFQNYNLLDHLTVFENVAISLKMIGIKNRFEIKKRVEYILECVGMYRYRNKPAGMLSGGQRQRVGIARAIVKNPNVIIADEPTGNLDSKNTIEIMNIIKAISKDKLVILVTHEKNLAEFYASRIISLEDGKVLKDEENIHENELDYRIDNKIYLKDFKTREKLEGSYDITLYSDKKEDLSLDIVIKNGNIYIKSRDEYKIEIVDDNSGIEFINDNYKKISKEDYEKTTFDLNKLDNNKYKLHYSSIYNIYTMFKAGFKKVANYTFMKKVLLIGFFVSAMFIVYAISNIFGITNIEDKDFVTVHKDYISIKNNKNDVEEFLKLEQLEGISYVIPGTSRINLNIKNENFFQLKDAVMRVNGSMVSLSKLEASSIIAGKTPVSDNGIVIDKTLIDFSKNADETSNMLNFKDYKDYIGLQVKFGNQTFTIDGISDSNNPCIYVNEKYFIDIIGTSTQPTEDFQTDISTETPNVKNYNLYKDTITIKKGRMPNNDYEVIVNIDNSYSMPLNKTITMTVNNKKLKVVGYYYSSTNVNDYYVSENTYKYNNIVKNNGIMVLAEDKYKTLSELKDLGYNAEDTYVMSKEKYINEVKDNIIQSIIISGILLAISFVEIFLMIRASFMSRIKEVGIYRAIGVKKLDIYKMFMGEVLIITTLAGVPGAVLMMLILNEITKISFFRTMFIIDLRVILVSLALIYILNLIVGLLPIRQTIKKTPAEILSRNDVD